MPMLSMPNHSIPSIPVTRISISLSFVKIPKVNTLQCLTKPFQVLLNHSKSVLELIPKELPNMLSNMPPNGAASESLVSTKVCNL